MDLIGIAVARGAGLGAAVGYGLIRRAATRLELECRLFMASVLELLRSGRETEAELTRAGGDRDVVAGADPTFMDCGIDVVDADGRVVGTALIPGPPTN